MNLGISPGLHMTVLGLIVGYGFMGMTGLGCAASTLMIMHLGIGLLK